MKVPISSDKYRCDLWGKGVSIGDITTQLDIGDAFDLTKLVKWVGENIHQVSGVAE